LTRERKEGNKKKGKEAVDTSCIALVRAFDERKRGRAREGQQRMEEGGRKEEGGGGSLIAHHPGIISETAPGDAPEGLSVSMAGRVSAVGCNNLTR